MPVIRADPTRSSRVRAALAVGAALVALLPLIGGCSDDSASPEPGTASAPTSSSTTLDPEDLPELPRYGIPELDVEVVGPLPEGIVALRAMEGRLFAYLPLGTTESELLRLDPATGEIVARRRLPQWEGWLPTEDGVMVLRLGRRGVDVYDLDTLEPLHAIELPADARGSLKVDNPRSGPIWMGLRRYPEDERAGIETRMGALRLDLAGGRVEDIWDGPPCGASTAVEIEPDVLVAGIECTHQIATVDLASGTVETQPALPAAPQLFGYDDAVYVRWKTLGAVGRLSAPDATVEMLDLNADGPTIADLTGFIGSPEGIWVAGVAADPSLDKVLFRLDPETFTVVARAWTESDVAFIDGVGFARRGLDLVRFDPTSVDRGAPRVVVRPEPFDAVPFETESVDLDAAIDALDTVMDPSVTDEVAGALLEDPEQSLPVRATLREVVAAAYPGVAPVVTQATLTDEGGVLRYVFVLDGEAAFAPLTATVVETSDGWKVTAESVCSLAAQTAIVSC